MKWVCAVCRPFGRLVLGRDLGNLQNHSTKQALERESRAKVGCNRQINKRQDLFCGNRGFAAVSRFTHSTELFGSPI